MRLVILDRDGVINEESSEYIKSPDEWIPIPGSLEAIARLHRAAYQAVVVTNQSGVGRGLFSINMLNRIHVHMTDRVRAAGGQIGAILFCPHAPGDSCQCRKPQSGLYQELANRLNVSLEGVPSVGDSIRDLQAAFNAGTQPILVRTGNGPRTLRTLDNDPPLGLSGVQVFDDLAQFVDRLLSNELQPDG